MGHSQKLIELREGVLLRILTALMVAVYTVNVVVLVRYFWTLYVDKSPYYGSDPFIVTVASLLTTFMLYGLKVGYSNCVRCVLISILLVLGNISIILWELETIGFLVNGIAISISGIIFGPKSGIAIFIALVLALGGFLLSGPQHHSWHTFETSFNQTSFTHLTAIAVLLGVFPGLIWLTDRDLHSALYHIDEISRNARREKEILMFRFRDSKFAIEQEYRQRLSAVSQYAEYGKLTSGLLHNLTNHLTVISLNLDRIRDEYELSVKWKSKGLEKALQRAADATLNITQYANSARAQIQQQDIRQKYNVCAEIKNVIVLFSQKAKRHQICIIDTCPRDIWIKGNPAKFNQCISNVLSNAIDSFLCEEHYENNNNHKHTSGIPVDTNHTVRKIRISASEDQSSIYISVEDNGCGIAEKNLDRIFQPFFTTKYKDGTGIGLSHTKEIIEEIFGGTVHVRSKPGKGTVFTMTIPKNSAISARRNKLYKSIQRKQLTQTKNLT